MGTPVGARVGAILSADDSAVHLLGYGVYDGEQVPPFGPMGMPLDEFQALKKEQGMEDFEWKNPRITLDDGRVVWGCQCWWGPEEQIRQKIGARTVVPAGIEEGKTHG